MHIDLSGLDPKTCPESEFDVSYDDGMFRAGGLEYPAVGTGAGHFRASCIEGGRVLLEGSAGVRVTAVCDRCLKEVPVELTAHVEQELEISETGCDIDMQEVLNKEFLNGWPMKILCSDDCKGLCGSCGRDLNLGPCGCSKGSPSSSMAAILDVFKNSTKEV